MNRAILPLIVIVSMFVPIWSQVDDVEWSKWKTKYGKKYANPVDDHNRRIVWELNRRLVENHNSDYALGKKMFKLGMNQFSDQKFHEPALLKSKISKSHKDLVSISKQKLHKNTNTVDWRTKGAVLPVENQGMIGSSIPFNIADAVASFSFINDHTKLQHLSYQEFLDCCLPQPIVAPSAFDCVRQSGGLCANGTYHHGNPCNLTSCQPVADVKTGGKLVPTANEIALMNAVKTTPVVATINASLMSFQLYQSGIYMDPDCNSTTLDHTVLVVGYGVEDANEYWICRNTWGTEWGEKGYIRIARNLYNMCGIATNAIYPY